MGNSLPKMILIGLDGAAFSLLNPWMKGGYLPNISKVFNNGASGNLKSTIPPVTAPAIASFATGKNPGETGYFDMFERKKDTYQIKGPDSKISSGLTFWNIINESRRVGILNLPLTYPPDNLNGFMISGFLTPPGVRNFIYPTNLLEKAGYKKKKYRINPFSFEECSRDFKEFYKAKISHTGMVAEVALKLAKKNRWDFLLLWFSQTDAIQHVMWKFIDSKHPDYYSESNKFKSCILEVYKVIDKFIGEIANRFENITICLMSDHGFGLKDYDFNINKWLLDLGLLSIKENSEIVSSNYIKGLQKIKDILIRLKLGRLRHSNLLQKINREVRNFSMFKGEYFDPQQKLSVDWSKTKAYTIGGYGGIYINLKGREPNGVVNKNEYDKLRTYIKNCMENIVDPNGDRFIDEVFLREDIYKGKYLSKAPDLVSVMESKTCYFYPYLDKLDSDLFTDDLFPYWSANHKLNGIFAISGEGIKSCKINQIEIIDLAPTILYYLGCPIPKDMDGRIVYELFEDSFVEKSQTEYYARSFKKTPNYKLSDKESEKLKEKLKGLGYLG